MFGLTALERWHDDSKELDIFVRAERVPEVKELLEKSQLEFKVIIENIQDAIDKENPPLSEDELTLVGRNGKSVDS